MNMLCKIKQTTNVVMGILALCAASAAHAVAADSFRIQGLDNPLDIDLLDGKAAKVVRTSYGTAHIYAKDLQGLGFGSGYAQAEDNICIIADGYIRAKGERSRYFGPDLKEIGDNKNVVSDFAIKALQVHEMAINKWPEFSENSKSLISGYVLGYNKYLQDVEAGKKTMSPECRGQEWVKPIVEEDVVAYLFMLSYFPGSANFLNEIMYAHPGTGNEWMPQVVGIRPAGGISSLSSGEPQIGQNESPGQDIGQQIIKKLKKPKKFPDVTKKPGSNAWGLGGLKTEDGKGLLLANPHMPLYGAMRFWESHAVIPGVLDVMGASFIGLPGVVNIGFNENISWTHTVSRAETFAIYGLALVPGQNEKYFLDGDVKDIQSRLIDVDVLAGDFIVTLRKEAFYTDMGPVLEFDSVIPWDDAQAFVIKDANRANMDILDHWLGINMANSLEEFQDVFRNFNGVMFNNTVYADRKGNSFFVDSSGVPDLSEAAIHLINTDPFIQWVRDQYSLTILPGHLSVFVYDALVPYENAPKIQRLDYVQNSNDSYWATNLYNLLDSESYSPLYGKAVTPLSLRTRMSLKMIGDSSGPDSLFNKEEVEAAMLSNRSYLAESILDDLLIQCSTQVDTPVVVAEGFAVDISAGCDALKLWNGRQDLDSVAGHLLREFAYLFHHMSLFEAPFDSSDPANTPASLRSDGSALIMLAIAIGNVESAGWPLDAKLGDVQFIERTYPNGQPTGDRIPFHGAYSAEGGFNTFSGYNLLNTSIYQSHVYPPAQDVLTGAPLPSGLSSEGYQLFFGSSWIMIVDFDKKGPSARGLLTYSQSSNPESQHYYDQTMLYSEKKELRPVLYRTSDIVKQIVSIDVLNYNANSGGLGGMIRAAVKRKK